MNVENVSTVLKDIKVTKKGINLTLEDARLQGEQLKDLATLIGEVILVAVSTPQMGMFDEKSEEGAEAEEILSMDAPNPVNYTDKEVANELGLA